MASSKKNLIHLCVTGSADFSRRMSSFAAKSCSAVTSGPLSETLSLALTNRPNLLVIEIGQYYSSKHQAWLKKTLAAIRERLGEQICIAIALTACEKFSFGGDLLFANPGDQTPSGFVDTFIISPPSGIASSPGIGEQLKNVLELYNIELIRRMDGLPALPALGHQNWVQSLADPISRELWMRWLPRYASYINESPIIVGETGTGKTKLAYALHILSGREGEFISITPRDFSSSELVQAELFGAVAGAYTGAVDKWGLVKSAEKGTLFIDELQSIDKDLQGKLITFIENKVYRRVGSAERTEADVRFVFASNKSLEHMIKADILRDDFAYRLERVQLQLQPLYKRRLDISAALAFALAKIHRQRPQASAIIGFSSAAYRLLFCSTWPGNLRQLENTVAQLCEVADFEDKQLIDEAIASSVLGSRLIENASNLQEILSIASNEVADLILNSQPNSLEEGLEVFSERVRLKAVEVCAGDIGKAAEILKENANSLNFVIQSAKVRKELKTI